MLGGDVMSGECAGVHALKAFFHRVRPSELHHTFSFPSGHTTNAVYLSGMLLLVFLPLMVAAGAFSLSLSLSLSFSLPPLPSLSVLCVCVCERERERFLACDVCVEDERALSAT
jgi:membrane-associated phospholipid phosphatase